MKNSISLLASVAFLFGTSLLQADLIDDFSSYPDGNVRDTSANTVWNSNGSAFADVTTVSGNKLYEFGWDNAGYRGAHRDLGANIGAAETSTLFYRVFARDDRIDHSIGATDVDTPITDNGAFPDFRAIITLTADGTANDGSFDLVAGGTTLSTGLAINTWYNVWMVIDNNSDTYDVYLNTGDMNATAGDLLNGAPLAFASPVAGVLDRFVTSGSGGADNVDHSVRLDDIHLNSGTALFNPTVIPEPGSMTLAAFAAFSGLGGYFYRRRKLVVSE